MNIFDGLRGKNDGAAEAEITQVENASKLKFPPSYREFISLSDGYFFKDQGVSVLSLTESLKYFQGLREFGLTQRWGYFPILDNNDSNPWCLCCSEPIEGYIVQVFHDDSAKIKFRNLDSFIAAIQGSERNDALMLDDLPGDFRDEGRTPHDIKVARELLKASSTLLDLDRGDACRFAMWLLSEGEVEDIVPLLEDNDFYIARDASERLAAMRCRKAGEALRENRKNFEAFVDNSLVLLREAGLKAVAVNRDRDILLNLGNLRLDMKVFYAERKSPDFDEKFIQRVKFLAAQKR